MRVSVALTVVLLTAPATTRAVEWTAPAERPNVVFILADDLGYGDLGCFGQRQVRTPRIDQLAAEGTRFRQCYAGSTVCAPSRCSLMTGLTTGHARVRGNARVPLRPEDRTVAEVLKGAGYATGLSGKWGLGEPGSTGIPNEKGFDTFFGFLNQGHAHNYYPDHLWRDRAKERLAGNVLGPVENVSTGRAQYATDLFIDEALRFLDAHREGPFFLYLATTLPHANNERGRAEGNGMEVPDLGPYADRPWPAPEKGLAAMISRLDSGIGRVLDRLQSLGLEKKTLVIFASDNGPHAEGGVDPTFFHRSGPLRGIKRDLYEGGIRVPAIVRWPGHVGAGAVSDQVWAFWDVLPTLAELAGAKVPAGLDGVSIATALTLDPKPIEHPPLYWEFHEGGFKQAARIGKWKGVRRGAGRPLELYDLDADLGETRDLSADHPREVARLEEFLKGARTDSADFPIGPARPARKR